MTSFGTPTEFPGWPGRAGFQVPLFFSAVLCDGTKQGIPGSGSVKERKQTTYGQSTPDMDCVCVGVQLLNFYCNSEMQVVMLQRRRLMLI